MTADMEILHESTPLEEILLRAEASHYPFFVVVNDQEELIGVLTLWDLRHALPRAEELGHLIVAGELMTREVVTIFPHDNFETALDKLESHNFHYLPVVLPWDPRKVSGVLRLDDVLHTYDQKVLRESVFRKPWEPITLSFWRKKEK
jgi:CIC family chloride channel protein